MIVVDGVLGNRYDDPRIGGRCAAAERDGRLETLRIPLLAAQRRRLRATTDADTEIGVSISEPAGLRDGDVLVDEEGGRVVVVSVDKFCTVQGSDRAFMEAVLRAHPIEGVRYEFSSLAR